MPPIITSMENRNFFLPDKKYYEYAYHKLFNGDVTYENWRPWDEWDYPSSDVERFGYIIGDNLAIINGHRVLDVACHIGYLSLFSLHNQATFVTGTNVRDRELSISKEICRLAGYENFDFVHCDLYDRQAMRALYESHETAIVSGILYHINNHYEFLADIAKSSIKNVIIESEVIDTPDSVVKWKFQNSDDPTHGYYEGESQVYVGVPSRKFLVDVLTHNGLSIHKLVEYEMLSSTNRLHRRVVITCVR